MKGLFGNLKRSDPHEAEARAALKKLREAFDELFRLRMLNEMAMRGQDKTCRYSAEEMRERIASFRDPEMEARFQREVWNLLKTIYRRDPTKMEVRAGPPSGDGLGLVPALFGIAAVVAGSAWGLHSITRYLSDRERSARGDPEVSVWGRRVERVIKGTIVATVFGGSMYGAYKLWKWQRSKNPEKSDKTMELPPPPPIEEDEEGEET